MIQSLMGSPMVKKSPTGTKAVGEAKNFIGSIKIGHNTPQRKALPAEIKPDTFEKKSQPHKTNACSESYCDQCGEIYIHDPGD